MKRLLKCLLIFVIAIVVLAGAAVGVAYVFLSDSTPSSYTYNAEDDESIQKIAVKSLADSLGKIYETNYENNKLEINISTKQLNDILTDTIKSSMNENYPNVDLLTYGQVSVKEVHCEANGDTLNLIASAQALGIFQTRAIVGTVVSMQEGDFLTFQLNTAALGKLTISSDDIKSLLAAFKDKIEGAVNNPMIKIDATNLTVGIDIKSMLSSSISNPMILHILECVDFSASYANDTISLGIDTSTLFTGAYAQPEIEDATVSIATKLALASASCLLGSSAEVSLSENEFNYLVQDNLQEEFNKMETSYTLEGTNFAMSLSKPYISIGDMKVYGEFSVNNVLSTISLSVDPSLTYQEDGTSVKQLLLSVKEASLGKIAFDSTTGVDFTFTADASQLLGGLSLKIQNIVFNQEEKTATLAVAA